MTTILLQRPDKGCYAQINARHLLAPRRVWLNETVDVHNILLPALPATFFQPRPGDTLAVAHAACFVDTWPLSLLMRITLHLLCAGEGGREGDGCPLVDRCPLYVLPRRQRLCADVERCLSKVDGRPYAECRCSLAGSASGRCACMCSYA